MDTFQDAAAGAWPGLPYGDDSIRWEVFAESLQDYAMLQTLKISPDDGLLASLINYEQFPKSEE